MSAPHPAAQAVRGQETRFPRAVGEFMCVCCADVVLHPRFFCWERCSARALWRCVGIATANYQINDDIRDKEVRVIGEDGAQLGIMSSAAALEIAEEKDLDLVKIAPGSNPPVCKIMDYGKYRFEQAKREKEAKKISMSLRSRRSGCLPALVKTISIPS